MASVKYWNPKTQQWERMGVMIGSSGDDIPAIVGATAGNKATEFSSLMRGTGKVESFVFFTDPHLLNSLDNEAQMREYLGALKLQYDATPTDFVISGGDWYGNSDTYDTACFKLGYIDGWMRRLFGDNYYPAVGNHDTNQQGKDETGGTWTGILPVETVRNLWFREYDNTYYSFDGYNTRFYVLDTWKEGTDAAYYWEQVAWLGEKLKTDNPENAALILHMGYAPSGDGYAVNTLAANALALCEAFNGSGAITLNGTTYDFTGCTGKVWFALSGHIHADCVETVNGIPLIATTHMRDGDTPTFDLCLADYDSKTLTMVRVGAGENRSIRLVEESPYVLITGINITGRSLYPNVKYRSVYASSVPYASGAVEMPWYDPNGSEYPYPVPYYPIEIPENATNIVVNCPTHVRWATKGWTVTQWEANDTVVFDSGWLSAGGGSYTIPDGTDLLIVLFEDNNKSDMSGSTYDISEFGVSFD